LAMLSSRSCCSLISCCCTSAISCLSVTAATNRLRRSLRWVAGRKAARAAGQYCDFTSFCNPPQRIAVSEYTPAQAGGLLFELISTASPHSGCHLCSEP
jgi:hypothetical protein